MTRMCQRRLVGDRRQSPRCDYWRVSKCLAGSRWSLPNRGPIEREEVVMRPQSVFVRPLSPERGSACSGSPSGPSTTRRGSGWETASPGSSDYGDVVDERAQTLDESCLAEALSVSTQGRATPAARPQPLYRHGDVVRSRLREEDTGRVLDEGVQKAAPAQGGRRLPECRSLERRQSEILVGRSDEPGAVAVEPPELLVGHGAEQPDVRPGETTELRFVGPVPDDDETLAAQICERFDDRIDVLVRQEARYAEVEAGLE